MFEKLIDLISAPFKRLKVFFQILVIAGLLLLMLGLEGLLGITTFETMDRFSQGIFSTGVQQIYDLIELRDNFDELLVNYLNDVSQSENAGADIFKDSLDIIKTQLNNLKKVSPESIVLIEHELIKVEELLKQPVNSINRQEFITTLFRIKYSCNTALDEIRYGTLMSLTEGRKYLDAAKWNTIVLIVVGVCLAVLFGLMTTVLIARPLKSVGATANALADGDLTKTISAKGSVEVTTLL